MAVLHHSWLTTSTRATRDRRKAFRAGDPELGHWLSCSRARLGPRIGQLGVSREVITPLSSGTQNLRDTGIGSQEQPQAISLLAWGLLDLSKQSWLIEVGGESPHKFVARLLDPKFWLNDKNHQVPPVPSGTSH